MLPEDSIQELMSDPDFVEAVMADKVKIVSNYWGSSEFTRVNEATGGVLDSNQHAVIELGFDFAHPHALVSHSTGLMFMR